MRVSPCSFCSVSVYPGRGTMFVRNDSKVRLSTGLARLPLAQLARRMTDLACRAPIFSPSSSARQSEWPGSG